MIRNDSIRHALLAALAALGLASTATAGGAAPARDPGLLADAAALRAFAAAERARPPAPRYSRADFLSRPMLRGARISPDGTQVAALVDDGRALSLRVATRAQPQGRILLARTSAQDFGYSHDGRWLFLAEPTRVLAVAMAGTGGSTGVAALGGSTHREFAGVDPWLPAAVLLLETPPVNASTPRLFRLWRARPGGKLELLHQGRQQIVDFAFAPDARLSHLKLAVNESYAVLRREQGGGWKSLALCRRMRICSLVGTANAGRDLLMRSNLDDDLLALLRVDADGKRTPLHRDPYGVAELDQLVFDARNNAPMIAAYRSTVARNHGLDARSAPLVAAIERRFPGRNLALDPGRAAWLVRERGGEVRGERLYLLDPSNAKDAGVELFTGVGYQDRGRVVARLPEATLARQRALRWIASDGLPVHGFLLLPPGVDAARAPLVVSVHGGPFNHVRPEFSTQAQFLANRGYVVFMPNFRSSTGYGRRHVLAARGDFTGDGPVQRDIVEGTRWLLANGIGDRGRVGIVGASFGGYSTLLGVSYQPELFRVGVASVPPSDFGFVMREYLGANLPMQPGIPIKASMRALGVDPDDTALQARLSAGSPQAAAARMSRPLLVLAGGEDDRVPIRGVTHYAATLKQLGKDVSLLVDASAGHGVADPRTREAYFYLEELLLHRALGGPAPAPPSKALAAHLARTLRVNGPSLK